MAAKKQVRIIKKVRDTDGVWRFVSLDRAGKKYVWDNRPGTYFLEWWEGRKRKREVAGQTPSEALEAQRRKGREKEGKEPAAALHPGGTQQTPCRLRREEEGDLRHSCPHRFAHT